MFEQSIEHYLNETQAAIFIDGQVHCPMCDCLHENTTLCQLSMEGGLL